METWFDRAAFDIFIAEGGMDDFEDLNDEELEETIREQLLEYVPDILEAAKRLKGWGT